MSKLIMLNRFVTSRCCFSANNIHHNHQFNTLLTIKSTSNSRQTKFTLASQPHARNQQKFENNNYNNNHNKNKRPPTNSYNQNFRDGKQNLKHLSQIRNVPQISSKKHCLEQFCNLSYYFFEDLKRVKWIHNFEERQFHIKYAADNAQLINVRERYAKSELTGKIIVYVDEKFNEFEMRDKAAMFKIFALMYQPGCSEKLDYILMKLERDFYDQTPLGKEFSIVDYFNYRDGFFYLK